jgi:hypothetical protein
MPTYAAVTAAIRRAIETDRFPAPRLDPLREGVAKFGMLPALKLDDEGRSEEREQKRHRPDHNDRDERRKQYALVPLVDQGEVPPTLV